MTLSPGNSRTEQAMHRLLLFPLKLQPVLLGRRSRLGLNPVLHFSTCTGQGPGHASLQAHRQQAFRMCVE